MSNNNINDELDKIFYPLQTDEEKISTRLEELNIRFTHAVSIHQKRSDFETENSDNYNCFEFALGLHKSGDYKKLRSDLARAYMHGIFCNSDFIKWLIDNNKLNADVYKGMEIIAIYSSFQKGITHAGILHDSSQDESPIISKFGNGHIYQHPENQVPTTYGFLNNYYEKPPLYVVEKLFKEYLQYIISNISGLLN